MTDTNHKSEEMNLEDIRRDYSVGSLSHSDMTEDPLDKCREWLEDSLRLNVIEPTALIVSTATLDGQPYKSQVGARISPQSHPIPNRMFIVTEFAKEALKVGVKVPRPESWGGFEVTPHRIEFWQGRPSRLHDRVLYLLQEDGNWSLTRIAP